MRLSVGTSNDCDGKRLAEFDPSAMDTCPVNHQPTAADGQGREAHASEQKAFVHSKKVVSTRLVFARSTPIFISFSRVAEGITFELFPRPEKKTEGRCFSFVVFSAA